MVHNLAVSLRNQGHEIIVLTNANKSSRLVIDEISIYTFPFISSLFNYQLSHIGIILSEVNEIFNHFSPDIVNIHGWFEPFSFYQSRVIEKKNIPVCLTIHGLLEQDHYLTENCLKVWNRAQAINTVSHALPQLIPHPCFQVIYNGLPISKKTLCPLPKQRLLMVGRLTDEKCFHIAFYALKSLLLKYPNLELTLVGNGPNYQDLWTLKESLNLPVKMPGFVPLEEVQDYIDQSTLVLVPSSYESFSLVALEAAFRARPVIASRVFGLKEVIEDQKTGILVEPKNTKKLAKAIDNLLSDPLKMELLGKNAFIRASHLFTIENTTNNYLRMYDQAVDLYNYSNI